jgi:hypothetical protein
MEFVEIRDQRSVEENSADALKGRGKIGTETEASGHNLDRGRQPTRCCFRVSRNSAHGITQFD